MSRVPRFLPVACLAVAVAAVALIVAGARAQAADDQGGAKSASPTAKQGATATPASATADSSAAQPVVKSKGKLRRGRGESKRLVAVAPEPKAPRLLLVLPGYCNTPDGSVQTLARSPNGDGSDGGLESPCEVLLRGNEVIVANMDMPVEGGVNTKPERPYTLSVIKLD